MWSDKETTEDLLGYTVHASLLKGVVTNAKNLPITIGLYGDWGLGKTSILKILEQELKKESDTVVVYFDGWSFESFDDAKMALIQGIVDALEKEKSFKAKVGDKIDELKAAFKKIRKSIGWMRLLKITAKSAIPIAAAASTGGASLIIPLLMDAFTANKDNLADLLTGDKAEEFLKTAIGGKDEDEKYEAVREFRKDFENLIEKSKQGRIVVLIDDLDRCLPRHIIENLEAIKLFLNVPKTAFVIAADSYIVSNAIKSEYKEIIDAAREERPQLGDSYMEKFIQLPYRIPALSPKEVETYVTLLFCQSMLDEDSFQKVRNDFESFTASNKFDCYGWSNIHGILKTSVPNELGETIGFVTRFSSIIGSSLKWNPRLIKTWNTPDLLKLMSADPKFSDVDLKELFWVSRDNIVEQMSGLSLISTRVKSVFNKAYNAGSDTILENVCRNEISAMAESDINEFFDLVDSKILTDPTEKDSFAIYYFCIMHNIEQAYKRLIDVLGRIDVTKMTYSLGNKFKKILERYNQDKKLIDLLSKNGRLMRSITGK